MNMTWVLFFLTLRDVYLIAETTQGSPTFLVPQNGIQVLNENAMTPKIQHPTQKKFLVTLQAETHHGDSPTNQLKNTSLWEWIEFVSQYSFHCNTLQLLAQSLNNVLMTIFAEVDHLVLKWLNSFPFERTQVVIIDNYSKSL